MAKQFRIDQPEEDIFVIYMGGTPNEKRTSFENLLNDEFVIEFHQALDEVEKRKGKGNAGSLILVSENHTTSKHFANGLDVSYLLGLEQREAQLQFLKNVEMLLLRLLTFPMPTIACLNGHAFAGGFLIALACDYRVMNKDRGFCCMTEVDLGSALTPGFSGLINTKLPRALAGIMMVEARKINASDMKEWRVVHAIASTSEVLKASIELGKTFSAKAASPALQEIKEDLYYDAAIKLRDAPTLRPKF